MRSKTGTLVKLPDGRFQPVVTTEDGKRKRLAAFPTGTSFDEARRLLGDLAQAVTAKRGGGRPRTGTLELTPMGWRGRFTRSNGERRWIDLGTRDEKLARARIKNISQTEALREKGFPDGIEIIDAREPFKTLRVCAGQRFGRYLVIDVDGARCNCRCDCGNRKAVAIRDLQAGKHLQCRACRFELIRLAQERFRADCEEAAASGRIFVGSPMVEGRLEWSDTKDYAVIGGVVLDATDLAKMFRIAAADLEMAARAALSRKRV